MAAKREIPNSFAAPAVAQGYEDQLPAMTAVAAIVVKQAPTMTSESVIHDNACGPGIVTSAILSRFQIAALPPPKIIATDIAPAMVQIAAKKGMSVDARVMDAKDLSAIASGSLTHSFTNFLFVRGWDESDMVAFASEICRTLRAEGGTAVKAAWKFHEWHDVVKDAIEATRPGGVEALIPKQPWSDETLVRDIFVKGGFALENISLRTVSVTPAEPIDWDSEVWKGLLAAINVGVMRNMTAAEKSHYEENLQKRVMQDRKERRKFRWEAWILTATK
ncbi:S-adenosyl-L-methionine-dependent methyltransferase [Xylaria scruposa]|nr:S-adenosyl-L-methionine-dependent methyltransferase [Xylaria scruposa]